MTENPLTEEQIESLNRISQLPLEEQKRKLPDFLKKLTPEQIGFLKGQQGNECVYCAIAEGKIKARKIYEDDSLIGALEIHPANKGHVILFPKKHYEILNQVDDMGHLFEVAKKLSGLIYENVKAEGTNIFVANGAAAGQVIPHLVVHIIPRFKNDKVQFKWEKIKIDDDEMDEIQKEINERLELVLEPVKIKEEKTLIVKDSYRIP